MYLNFDSVEIGLPCIPELEEHIEDYSVDDSFEIDKNMLTTTSKRKMV